MIDSRLFNVQVDTRLCHQAKKAKPKNLDKKVDMGVLFGTLTFDRSYDGAGRLALNVTLGKH